MLEVKVDTYVLETDVHFPTDLNLLWDAGRKCVDLVAGLRDSGYDLPGWRELSAKVRESLLGLCDQTVCASTGSGSPISRRCWTSIWTWSSAGC